MNQFQNDGNEQDNVGSKEVFMQEEEQRSNSENIRVKQEASGKLDQQQGDMHQNKEQGYRYQQRNNDQNQSQNGEYSNANLNYSQHNNAWYGYMSQANAKPVNKILQYNPTLNDFDRLGISPKRVVSWAFFSLFVLAAVTFGTQALVEKLVHNFKPELADTDWYVWAVTLLSLVIIGTPIYYLVIRRIPDSPKGETMKMTPLRFIVILFICTAAMYISNMFTLVLTFFLSLIKGEPLYNPLMDVMLNGNYLITLLYAAIVAPIIEETIFRKLLLNKLRRFGDIPAILMTGLAFGIFHFNLSQFFYAATLGFIFAYVAIRTNTIVYTILLHMIINFTSTALTPLVTGGNIVAAMLLTGWMLAAITLGSVFFIIFYKKIHLERIEPVMKTSYFFLNPGTIMYVAFGLVWIVYLTVFVSSAA